MNAIGRNLTGMSVGIVGIGAFIVLTFGLVFLKLSPILIATLLIGGGILAISTFRPYLGVHVMLGLMYFEEARFRVTEDVTFTKVMGALITVGWLVNTLTQKRLRDVFTLQGVLVSAYLAWCAFSAANALDTDMATNRLMTYVLLALSMMAIGSVVDSPLRLRNLLFATALWTIVTAVIALAMYYMGLTPVASGLTGNRNLLATYINVGAVAALLVYPLLRAVLPRLFLLVGIPTLLLALALTLSRTGLIVMAISILTVWYRLARERGFLVLLGSTLACVALLFFLPGAFWTRASTILPSIERQEDTFGMRVRLWETGIRLVEDYPLLGTGPGNFPLGSARYASGVIAGLHLNSHNAYVGTAAETGLPGFALFVAVLFSAMVGARRSAAAARQAGRTDLGLLGVTVETMLLALMLSAITGNAEASKILWIGLGMCVAFIGIVRRTLAVEVARVETAADPGLPEVQAT
ncbi:MAG TPA: O-antigen ligase family protein [Candidatus Polarisedimenticolia bacterium]|nr:O-antigen ligase family protein [Candidatus Polarisedimenticolia bacterium]